MSKGYPSPPLTGTKVLTATTGAVTWENSGAGGSDHAAGSNLIWTASAHTGTASQIAGFSGAGAAAYYAIGSDIMAYDATMLVDADIGGSVMAYDATMLVDADIGGSVQAYDANLDQIAALAVTDGNFQVGNGTAWVAESGATARTSMGVGTGDALVVDTITGSTSVTGGTVAKVEGGVIHGFEGPLGVSGGIFNASKDSANTGFYFYQYTTAYAALNASAYCSVYASQMIFGYDQASGTASFKIRSQPTSGTNLSLYYFGQGVSTTNRARFLFYENDGTTIGHYLQDAGGVSYLCGSGGTLGVGITSPSTAYALDVYDSSTGFVVNVENANTGTDADGVRIELGAAAVGTNNYFLEFLDAGGNVGEVTSDGAGGVAYVTSSDRALKKNIRAAAPRLTALRAVQVREFEWRANDTTETGFVAQELAEHWPSAVHDPTARNASMACASYTVTEESQADDDGGTTFSTRIVTECASPERLVDLAARSDVSGITSRPLVSTDAGWRNWGIDYGRLTPLLLKSTQELADTVDEQAATIALLIARIEALEA